MSATATNRHHVTLPIRNPNPRHGLDKSRRLRFEWSVEGYSMSDTLSDSLWRVRVHIHRFPSRRRFPSVPRLSPTVDHSSRRSCFASDPSSYIQSSLDSRPRLPRQISSTQVVDLVEHLVQGCVMGQLIGDSGASRRLPFA